MNKLKGLFKKDKDVDNSQSGSYGSTDQSNSQSGSYGSAQQSTPPQQQQQRQQQHQQPTGSSFPPNDAPSTGADRADNAEGVVLHTTLGDITIALFSQQTPRVRTILTVIPNGPETVH